MEESKKDSMEDKNTFFGWLKARQDRKKNITKKKVIAVITGIWNIIDDKGKSTGIKKYTTFTCSENKNIRLVEMEGHQNKQHPLYHKYIIPWLNHNIDNKKIEQVAKILAEEIET